MAKTCKVVGYAVYYPLDDMVHDVVYPNIEDAEEDYSVIEAVNDGREVAIVELRQVRLKKSSNNPYPIHWDETCGD